MSDREAVDTRATQRQREPVREGRRAEAAGLPVIYIHGRPYADPGADLAEDPPFESPFPWDLWDE